MPKRVSPEAVRARARVAVEKNPELTMAQIAASAGISQATLYGLFGSRKVLMSELGVGPPPTAEDRIVTAAAVLVVEGGLYGLSVEGAAARAGVSRAAAYRLFSGKGPLFHQVIRRHMALEDLAAIISSMRDRPPSEVLPVIGAMVAAATPSQLAVLRVLYYERSRDIEEATTASIAVTQALAGYLEAQMAAGRLCPMHPYVAVIEFLSPLLMYMLNQDLIDAFTLVDDPPSVVIEGMITRWLDSMRPTRRQSNS